MSNYLQQRNIYRQKLRSRLIGAVLIAGLFFGLYVMTPEFWSGLLRNAARPLWIARSVLESQTSEYIDLLKSKRALVAENRALRDRLDGVELALFDRSLILDDNARLLKLLGRDETRSSVVARVLATPRQSPYDTLVLDVGLSSNIGVGDAVFVEGEIPVGYISAVHEKSALATLYSSPREKVEALFGSDAIPVVLKGRGGGNFILTLPRGNNNSKGDRAFLAQYPTDVLAIVESVEMETSSPFATLRLRSPVNIHNISIVEVIISSP